MAWAQQAVRPEPQAAEPSKRPAPAHAPHADPRPPEGRALCAERVMQLQRTVGNRATGALVGRAAARRGADAVQRMVLKISDDDMTKRSYANLIAQQGVDPASRPAPTGRRPLTGLGPAEDLYVVLHGTGARETVEGDATDVLAYLVREGFDPAHHGGAIRLIVCNAGTPDTSGASLASDLAGLLHSAGHRNTVIGYNGMVQVRSGGGVWVVAPADAARWWELWDLNRKYRRMSELQHRKLVAQRQEEREIATDEQFVDLERDLLADDRKKGVKSEQELLEQELELLVSEEALKDRKQQHQARLQAIARGGRRLAQLIRTATQEQASLWHPASAASTAIHAAPVDRGTPIDTAIDIEPLIARIDEDMEVVEPLLVAEQDVDPGCMEAARQWFWGMLNRLRG